MKKAIFILAILLSSVAVSNAQQSKKDFAANYSKEVPSVEFASVVVVCDKQTTPADEIREAIEINALVKKGFKAVDVWRIDPVKHKQFPNHVVMIFSKPKK